MILKPDKTNIMKQLVCVICVLGFCQSLSAQVSSLCLSTKKTTSLVFPFPVKHVDRGTRDVLVEQVREADNILLVKAGTAGFAETNLSVVTADGSLYTFAVCFEANPLTWVYELPVQTKASVATYAKALLDNPPTLKRLHAKQWNVEVGVTGIYVKNDVLYFQLQAVNKTAIDYTVEYLRFYIRDRHQLKRTAVQEVELTPLVTAGNAKTVKAAGGTTFVVALDKFVIPDQKLFIIEMGEKGGGRNLSLGVRNGHILKAFILPDLQ